MPRSTKQKKERVTLLVDADIPVYQYAAAGQRVYDFADETGGGTDDDVCVAVDDISVIGPQMDDEIERLRTKLHADAVIMCLTSPDNFRKTVLPTYKGNRKVKPVLIPAIREYLRGRYTVKEHPGLEGDDVMGILSTHPHLIKGDKVIVSIDKDMRTVPGWLFNPNKDGTKPQRITVEEADYYHMFQTLTGDPTDNYKGIPGVGPKKAEAILEPARKWGVGEMWANVVYAYEEHGLSEADALVQARCARILRWTDYNFTTKEPILWQPPKQ